MCFNIINKMNYFQHILILINTLIVDSKQVQYPDEFLLNINNVFNYIK